MNTKRALEKLDEFRLSMIDVRHYTYLEELREILIALDDDGGDKQFLNKYQDVVNRIKQVCNRIEAIESKCGCKVKWKESIEKRIGELEKYIGNVKPIIQYDCQICGARFLSNDGICPNCKPKEVCFTQKPSSPSKTEQTQRELALEVAEILWKNGWQSGNDAQTENLERALPRIYKLLHGSARTHQDPSKVSIDRVLVANMCELIHSEYPQSCFPEGMEEFERSIGV